MDGLALDLGRWTHVDLSYLKILFLQLHSAFYTVEFYIDIN